MNDGSTGSVHAAAATTTASAASSVGAGTRGIVLEVVVLTRYHLLRERKRRLLGELTSNLTD